MLHTSLSQSGKEKNFSLRMTEFAYKIMIKQRINFFNKKTKKGTEMKENLPLISVDTYVVRVTQLG
jgi:hypothetical protein